MSDLEARIERAQKELSGNESLLEMLEGEAASEMFEWGQRLAASVVMDTEGMDDAAAEQAVAPRLKALRQAMRSIGNWAAGKYSETEDRAALKNKISEQLQLILGEKSSRLSTAELEAVIDSVDQPDQTPHQMILKLKDFIEKIG